jgi:hypothetical protein
MAGDFEKELPVAPAVNELISRWLAKGDATQNERAGMVDHGLFSSVPLLTD